ncbi:hypothetical protein NUW58_g1206 [Xylaria curta]|uniref:Uncharacterized protein n=1 Tax=Xylaria curta TaxID=42375 RepID=A0ACC1PL88_9PEZI|nr:hypothetical protein NUW58_g1206 [Xylaria curta]
MDDDAATIAEPANQPSSRQAAPVLPLPAYPKATYGLNVYTSFPILQEGTLFRVLDLRESPRLEDPLTGSLRVSSFDQDLRPKFHALSYVWGSKAEPPDTIQIQGRASIEITRNCRDALRQLRHLYGNVSIWVDAICIDQNSREEKTHQIPLMRIIYTWAEFVYIWLGPGNQATHRAMNCLITAGGLTLLPLDRDPSRDRPSVWATLRLLFLSFMYMYSLKARKKAKAVRAGYNPNDLVEFLEQDWFKRVWTFQEFILACNPVFFTPSHTLRLEALIRGLTFLNLREFPFSKYGFSAPYAGQGGRYTPYSKRPEFPRFKNPPGVPTIEALEQLLAIWMWIDQRKPWEDRFSVAPTPHEELSMEEGSVEFTLDQNQKPRVAIFGALWLLFPELAGKGTAYLFGEGGKGTLREIDPSAAGINKAASIRESVSNIRELLLAIESLPYPQTSRERRFVLAERPTHGSVGNIVGPGAVSLPARTTNPLDLIMLTNQQNSVNPTDARLKMTKAMYKMFCPGGSHGTVAEVIHALQQDKEIFDFFIEVINDLASNKRRMFVTSDGFRGCGSKDIEVGDRLALVAGVPAPLVLRPAASKQPWFETEYTMSCSAFVPGLMEELQFLDSNLKEIKLV